MIRGVPSGLHRSIRDELVSILQGSKQFANSRIIKSWSCWNGKAGDASPPTTDQMPWCRLSLLTGPCERVARRGGSAANKSYLKETLSLQVELACAETDQGDVGDVWDQIHEVLFPEDEAARVLLDCRLRRFGVQDLDVKQPCLPGNPEQDFGPDAVFATGVIQLVVYLAG
jgi:hypothetical protein